jgi:hypothetical protein
MNTAATETVKVSVKRHPLAKVEPCYATCWVGIVELPSTKVYTCRWVLDDGAPLTEDEVLAAWRKHRNWFKAGYCY